MSHQVIWTARVTEFFISAGNLSPLEADVLKTRIMGMTIQEQSLYFNLSCSSISRIIAKLKRVYDECQREFPDELQPRKSSAAETYMDTH